MTDIDKVYDDRGNLPIFIHSQLDDLGLTPEAFRVYCHLVRRTGRDGAYPKQQSIADICFPRVQRRDADCARLDKPVSQSSGRVMVIKAIEALEEHGLITQHKRIREDGKNTSSIYSLRPHAEWRSWDQLPKKTTPPRSPGDLGPGSPGDLGPGSPGDLGPGSPGDLHKGTPTIEVTPNIEESNFSEKTKTGKSGHGESPGQDPEQTLPSSAAPFPPPSDPTRDRLTRRELPSWRSGGGPNAWVPEIIDEIHADLSRRMPELFSSRSDTIGWVAKRDKPSHDEHAVLTEKAREAAARIANRTKQTAPTNGPTRLQIASAIDDYRRYEFDPSYPPSSFARAEDWDAMTYEEQLRRAQPYLQRYLNEKPDPSLPS